MGKIWNSEQELERLDYKKVLTVVVAGSAIGTALIYLSLDFSFVASLIFFAVGIYFYNTAIKVIRILNVVCEDEGVKSRDGLTVIFLIHITLGLYGVYWINKQSKRMMNKAGQYKITTSGHTALQWFVVWLVYQFFLGVMINKWELEYGYRFWLIKKCTYLSFGMFFVGILLAVICLSYFLRDLDCLVVEHNRRINMNDSEIQPVEPATIRDYSIYQHYLECVSGMYEGVRFPLEDNEYIMLGREGQKSNIVFDDSMVSRQHCQIRYNAIKRKFEIIDHSSVGTYAEGKRLEPEKVSFFPAGTQIQLGSSDNIFVLQEEKEIL